MMMTIIRRTSSSSSSSFPSLQSSSALFRSLLLSPSSSSSSSGSSNRIPLLIHRRCYNRKERAQKYSSSGKEAFRKKLGDADSALFSSRKTQRTCAVWWVEVFCGEFYFRVVMWFVCGWLWLWVDFDSFRFGEFRFGEVFFGLLNYFGWFVSFLLICIFTPFFFFCYCS